MRRLGALPVLLLILLAAAPPLTWALNDALADGVRRCAAQTDQSQRLACFDALAATLPKIEADRFGLTADIANKRDPASERRAKEAILPGKIISLGQGRRGEYIFTLDNGQVWMQAEVEPNKKFAVGDVVHIERGAMSSLWLAADKARKTRVKRIS